MTVPVGYRKYGADSGAFAAIIASNPTSPQPVLSAPGAKFWVRSSEGGARITDLYNRGGLAVTEVTADSQGFVIFWAAPTLGSLWLEPLSSSGVGLGVYTVVQPATLGDDVKQLGSDFATLDDSALRKSGDDVVDGSGNVVTLGVDEDVVESIAADVVNELAVGFSFDDDGHPIAVLPDGSVWRSPTIWVKDSPPPPSTSVWKSTFNPSALPDQNFFDDITTNPIPDTTPAGVSGFPWTRVIANDTTFYARAWAGPPGNPGPVLAVALRKQGYGQTRDTSLGSGSAVAGIFWRFGLDEESSGTEGSLVILWRIEAGVWVTVRRVGGVPKISIYNVGADTYTDVVPTGFDWDGQTWGATVTGFIEGDKHVFAMRLNGSTSKLWIDTQEFTFDGSGVSNPTIVLGTDPLIGAGFGHATVGQIGCAYFTVAPIATEAEVLTERDRLITVAAGLAL